MHYVQPTRTLPDTSEGKCYDKNKFDFYNIMYSTDLYAWLILANFIKSYGYLTSTCISYPKSVRSNKRRLANVRLKRPYR